MYVCGFPCKPFSALRHGSLRDRNARPFFAVRSTLRQALLQLALLFGKLHWHWAFGLIEAADMGELVWRPRCCFVLIRLELALVQGERSSVASQA